MSVFETLNSVSVNGHTEKKGGLTYLSWAWAWAEVKKRYPEATYTIYEKDGIPYFTDGRTCWVKTGVTIEGLEHIEYLPIMDFRNNSIPLAKVTSMDMNKSIQRSLTKACARHGLGLYIYAGEDLPEAEQQKAETEAKQEPQAQQKAEDERPQPQQVGEAEADPQVAFGKLKAQILKHYTETLKPNQQKWVLEQFKIEDIANVTPEQCDTYVKSMKQSGLWNGN